MRLLKKVNSEADKVAKIILEGFEEEKRELQWEDGVTIAFFEDMVQKTNSLITLIEAGSFTAIDTITRSVFESHVYLQVLLTKENRIYGRSYFAAVRSKELGLLQSIIQPGRKGERIRRLLGRTTQQILTEFGESDPKILLQQLENEFSDVFSLRQSKHNWYNLDGKTGNFEQLCNRLELGAEYELLYRQLSSEVHSMDVMKRIQYDTDQVTILTGNSQIDMNTAFVSSLLRESVVGILEFYGHKEHAKKFITLMNLSYQFMKKY
ncbi:DUF5677 domain-containing protein (plasmid) [Alkalihalophilus sp. As8PL]|uniref:DUF5677 domain-containing protein n=1 Tax=Alkalihalophilus sp. As8PL TaxID=3237103 RepID=A0AB39BMW8_9BACI